jgi:hypothetical protein
VLGFYLRLEDMSSPRYETEWANRFTGLYIHTTPPSVGLGPVTTPSEIIPYYRLNHSIWSLSGNKEPPR